MRPDMKTARQMIEDHCAIYACTFEGRHKQTGRPVRFSGWEEWDLDDDLNAVKSLGWFDVADFERQVAGQRSGR